MTAASRGWGPGWPHDNSSKMGWVRAPVSGARWQVDRRVAPLVLAAITECELHPAHPYLFDHGSQDTNDDWGFANRAIRGTNTASNHSWGLAIDIDAQEYPQGQLRRQPPQWVINIFGRYGFSYGGQFSRPDPMHFEFLGTPADAAARVARLGKPQPQPEAKPQPLPPVNPQPAPKPQSSGDAMPPAVIRDNQTGLVAVVDDFFWRRVTPAQYAFMQYTGDRESVV